MSGMNKLLWIKLKGHLPPVTNKHLLSTHYVLHFCLCGNRRMMTKMGFVFSRGLEFSNLSPWIDNFSRIRGLRTAIREFRPSCPQRPLGWSRWQTQLIKLASEGMPTPTHFLSIDRKRSMQLILQIKWSFPFQVPKKTVEADFLKF